MQRKVENWGTTRNIHRKRSRWGREQEKRERGKKVNSKYKILGEFKLNAIVFSPTQPLRRAGNQHQSSLANLSWNTTLPLCRLDCSNIYLEQIHNLNRWALGVRSCMQIVCFRLRKVGGYMTNIILLCSTIPNTLIKLLCSILHKFILIKNI